MNENGESRMMYLILSRVHLIGEGATEEEALQQMLTLLMSKELKLVKVLVDLKKTTSKKKGGY